MDTITTLGELDVLVSDILIVRVRFLAFFADTRLTAFGRLQYATGQLDSIVLR